MPASARHLMTPMCAQPWPGQRPGPDRSAGSDLVLPAFPVILSWDFGGPLGSGRGLCFIRTTDHAREMPVVTQLDVRPLCLGSRRTSDGSVAGTSVRCSLQRRSSLPVRSIASRFGRSWPVKLAGWSVRNESCGRVLHYATCCNLRWRRYAGRGAIFLSRGRNQQSGLTATSPVGERPVAAVGRKS